MVRIRQRAVARGSQSGLAGAGFRQGLVLLAVGAALWLLQGQFAEIDVPAVLSGPVGACGHRGGRQFLGDRPV